jgi:hypothetical protein
MCDEPCWLDDPGAVIAFEAALNAELAPFGLVSERWIPGGVTTGVWVVEIGPTRVLVAALVDSRGVWSVIAYGFEPRVADGTEFSFRSASVELAEEARGKELGYLLSRRVLPRVVPVRYRGRRKRRRRSSSSGS